MLEIAVDELARLPDVQKGVIPSLHTLINQFGRESSFLEGYLAFLKELRSLGVPTIKPSFWPLIYRQGLTTEFSVAMDRWGYNDRQVRLLPIPDKPNAIVYLSAGIPVLYRAIGRTTPEVDGTIGAPLSPEYAAAVGYNAAYEQFLLLNSQQNEAA